MQRDRRGEDGDGERGDRQDRGDRNRRRRQPRHRAQYWMVVTSLENFRRTRDRGFNLLGLRSRHRRRAEVMRPGDRIVFYVGPRRAFAATATLTSGMLEDRQPIWDSPRPEESHPWRFRMRVDEAPDERDWIPGRHLAYRMEYVRKWPPEEWALAFQGHVHQLPQKDFKLVEVELERLRGARPEHAESA